MIAVNIRLKMSGGIKWFFAVKALCLVVHFLINEIHGFSQGVSVSRKYLTKKMKKKKLVFMFISFSWPWREWNNDFVFFLSDLDLSKKNKIAYVCFPIAFK